MLKNAESIELQISQILYTFVLHAEVCATFGSKLHGYIFRILQHFATKPSINGSIAFIFSVKICLAVKRNANSKFKCGRMHGSWG